MRRILSVVLAMCVWGSVLSAWAEETVPPTVSAVSAVLFEPVTGTVLFEKDAHTPRAMASTTKLMTALLAAESDQWDATVEVTAEMVRVEGSSLGLRGGDRIVLRDLVSGMLLVSGNDAANAVAGILAGSVPAFVAHMNARAAALGMEHSYFATPSGLDGEGHAACAYDMALLGAAVAKNERLAAICEKKSDTIRINDRTVTVSNHNRLLSLYEYATGLKTGFTKKAGRCLVSAAQRDGVTLVAVTLNDGNDWKDHMALLEYGFSQVRAVELPEPPMTLLPVAGGVTDVVTLNRPDTSPLILPSGQMGVVQLTVKLPRFVLAPVAEGDVLGEAVYSLDGEVLCQLTLTAAEEVAARPVASPAKRFGETLRLLFAALLTI